MIYIRNSIELTFYFVLVPSQLQKVVYSPGKALESLPKHQYYDTITVIPNATYSISVDILRHQKTDSVEKFNKIIVGGLQLGNCQPEAYQNNCTFVPCSNINKASQEISSETGEIDVVMEVEGHSWACNCDTNSWKCSEPQNSVEQMPIVVAAKIKLEKLESYKAGNVI